MIQKSILKKIISDQRFFLRKTKNIIRDKLLLLPDDEEITIISGIRRCGKSTLLNQIRNRQNEKDYFLNFDDERIFNFTVADFQNLHETFIELFGEQKTFYFDEIQNIPFWERFIRRLYDYGNKIFITGSNAQMLSKELGTHLTGRHYQFDLFPFSFREFLKFTGINFDKETFYSTTGKVKLLKNYYKYTKTGGLPVFVKNKNPEYLKSLFNSILYKDVLVRNKLTNESIMLELTYYLASNISKQVSYNNLAKMLNVKNASTIKNYLGYLQNTYLIFLISKYDFSLKKQIKNPKKIYFIDTALANIISFSFSENKGRILENIVFLELKRRMYKIYYHKNKFECDFVIHEGMKITQAIQVSVSLYNINTKEREIRGLYEAMEVYKLSVGIIITEDEEEILTYKNKKIEVKPIWKWLLHQ